MITLLDQANAAAAHIKKTGQTTLHLHPLRKSERAHANIFRRLLFSALLSNTPLPRGWEPGTWTANLQALTALYKQLDFWNIEGKGCGCSQLYQLVPPELFVIVNTPSNCKTTSDPACQPVPNIVSIFITKYI